MYKLIVILIALIPLALFLRTILFGRSKVVQGAMSDFRRHIDYLVWGILVVIGVAVVYAIVKMTFPMWQ